MSDRSPRFRIRPARIEDAGAMIAVLNPIIEAGSFTIMQKTFTREEQIEYVRGFPERGLFHVAAADGSETGILGMQSVEPVPSTSPGTFAHVGDISTFVAPGARRLGVGRALTRVTIEGATKKGWRKLTANVRADNPGAVAFYESAGFRVIGVARDHARVRGVYVDEVLLELLLAKE